MELILWRHAEAEEGEPDAARALTAKGHKQAKKMAYWLDRHLPSTCKVLASPTVRTQQTVQALERRFKIVEEIGPDAAPETILAAANWPDSKEPVLIVGHQPTLGQVAALLLTGKAQDCTIRKGNVWWIVQKDHGEDAGNYLKAVMSPEMVTK